MAPASKGKVGTDHVKAFNVAVAEWKSKPSEKILTELDRILAVLAKTSDPSVFCIRKPEVLSLLINCQLVVSGLDHKAITTWSVISLLSSLCSRDRGLSVALRDRTWMVPVCAKLLHSLPSTTQARTLKLLSFMKMVCVGVRLTRREAWLSSSISDLVSFLSNPELSSPSLFLLACLCQGNYIATKMVISSLDVSMLTTMMTTNTASASDQLTAEVLLHSMTKYQLSRAPPSQSKVQSYLPALVDVFCSSYGTDDIPMMSLIISFLSSLASDPDLQTLLGQQDCLPHLNQLLLVHDFSEGFCVTGASLIFTLMTGIVTSYKCDHVTVFDQTLKMILIRLDAKPNQQVSSALDFLIQLLGRIDFGSLPDAALRNIKFQLDQLLPSLISLLVDFQKARAFSPEMLASLLKCLSLLETIALLELEGWSQSVAVNLKSSKLMLAYKGCCEALDEVEDRARLTVEFLSLSALLAELDHSWSKVEAELLGDPARVSLLTALLRLENTEGQTMKKTLRLLSKVSCPRLFEEEEEVSPAKLTSGGPVEDQELPGETLSKIDNMLEDVQAALDKMQLEDVVVEVLELADKRRGQERRQNSHLEAALAAADERLAAQNLALVERQEEVRCLERTRTRLVARLAATREEVEDLRSQHGELSREADSTRDRLGRELEDLQAQLEQLAADKQNMVEKVVKFKGQVVSLTKDLELYQENQDQLEKKLKQEMKMKEEVAAKLAKREDKLRKKERQLEEEMNARERLEKENEEIKKQCSSLETLSKRQEQALSKKEKQLQDSQDEVKEMKKIQDAIFNLSKTRNNTSGAC